MNKNNYISILLFSGKEANNMNLNTIIRTTLVAGGIASATLSGEKAYERQQEAIHVSERANYAWNLRRQAAGSGWLTNPTATREYGVIANDSAIMQELEQRDTAEAAASSYAVLAIAGLGAIYVALRKK